MREAEPAGPGIAERLGIGPATRVRVVGTPAPGLLPRITVAPAQATPDASPADVVLAWLRAGEPASERLADAAAGLAVAGVVWVCFPVHGQPGALAEHEVLAAAAAAGLVDTGVARLGATHVAVRLVRRRHGLAAGAHPPQTS